MKTGSLAKGAVSLCTIFILPLFIPGCEFPPETRPVRAVAPNPALKLHYTAKRVPVRHAGPARAGVRQIDKSGDSILYSGGKVEYRPASAKNVVIFNSEKDMVIQIDHKNRAYSVGDLDAYCGAVKSRIIRVIKRLPPGQRASMRRFLGLQNGPRPPRVMMIINGGPGGLIAGFRTKKYVIMVDGRKYEELWISRDRALIAQQKKMIVRLKSRFDACMSLDYGLEMGLPSVERQPIYRKLKDSGWPMKKDFYFKGRPYFDWEVAKLSIGQVPGKEFLPPHGFKKISMRQMAFRRAD